MFGVQPIHFGEVGNSSPSTTTASSSIPPSATTTEAATSTVTSAVMEGIRNATEKYEGEREEALKRKEGEVRSNF